MDRYPTSPEKIANQTPADVYFAATGNGEALYRQEFRSIPVASLLTWTREESAFGDKSGGNVTLVDERHGLDVLLPARRGFVPFLAPCGASYGADGFAQLRMWRAWQRTRRAAEVVPPFPAGAPQTQLTPELQPTDMS